MFEFQYCLCFISLLLPLLSIDSKVIQTKISTKEESCNKVNFKNPFQCDIKNFHLIAHLQAGHSTVPFLIDTGSSVCWVLTKETKYRLITENKVTIKDYGNDWTQFFTTKPTDITQKGSYKEDHKNYGSPLSVVDYKIYDNPLELKSGNWNLKLKMGLATRYSHTKNKHRDFVGIIALEIPADLSESFLYQSYIQHKGNAKPMVSFDVNFKNGIPSSAKVGFGLSVLPSGIETSKKVSVRSDSSKWTVELSHIKFQIPNAKTVNYHQVIRARLDVGANMIRLPDKIKNELPADKRDFAFGLKVFPCDKWQQYLPIISLSFGNKEITLSPKFLYWKSTSTPNKCKSLITGQARTGEVVLGFPFFAAIYTEFHFEPDPKLSHTARSLLATVDMVAKN